MNFAKTKLGRDKAVGTIPFRWRNLIYGEVHFTLGHPFGATGARLVTTASNRLIAENGKYALIAACVQRERMAMRWFWKEPEVSGRRRNIQQKNLKLY